MFDNIPNTVISIVIIQWPDFSFTHKHLMLHILTSTLELIDIGSIKGYNS